MSSIISRLLLVLPISLLFFGFIIQDPKPQACTIKTIQVQKIHESGTKDIVLLDTEGGSYYINRGLERGLQLTCLAKEVVDKSITLHLANVLYGSTAHIAQITVNSQVIYTEFEQ